MSYEHILYEVSDRIATITLNRPDRMNAWTAIMERDVRHAMEAAASDDNVRVIVLTGAGRGFCAGADMDALKGIDPNEVRRGENIPFDMNRRADWQTRYAYYPAIRKPVIAMLNGPPPPASAWSTRCIAICASPPTPRCSPPPSRGAA
ncbi:enoyl-CoA hydratase/carnithine racemase [Bradyrhizobium elkanii]